MILTSALERIFRQATIFIHFEETWAPLDRLITLNTPYDNYDKWLYHTRSIVALPFVVHHERGGKYTTHANQPKIHVMSKCYIKQEKLKSSPMR